MSVQMMTSFRHVMNAFTNIRQRCSCGSVTTPVGAPHAAATASSAGASAAGAASVAASAAASAGFSAVHNTPVALREQQLDPPSRPLVSKWQQAHSA